MSCMQRWKYHLSGTDKSEITEAEEIIIVKYYSQGKTFAKIAEKLENRSCHWVKHQYDGILRKRIRTIR